MHRSCFCVSMHAQSCRTLCDPRDCGLSDSSVHGISQASILEWTAISSFRSSQPRDQTRVSWVSWITGRFYTTWAIKILCIDASVSQLWVSHANSDAKWIPETVPRRCPGSRRQSPSSCREMLCGSALGQWRNAPSGFLWYFYCELPENNRTNGFQGNRLLEHVGFHHYKNNIDLWQNT